MADLEAAAFTYPTPDELIEQARQTTGLNDFGPNTFQEGLGVLLDSLSNDARLPAAQAARAVTILQNRLVNRLQVEAYYKAHPETANLPIDGPVSIIGLPRTGTTALANIMSQDDQFRCLRSWEQAKPCPPPNIETEASDERRLQALAEIAQLSSEEKAKHLYDVDATVEDTEVLGLDFKAQQFTHAVFSYHNWWRNADMTPTYAYHRRVVQLLQSHRPPNRWLFKAPHHKFHLDALVAAYPDIRFVMTHRDPVKSVPSYASFVSTLFPKGSGGDDHVRLGQHVSEHLRQGMERAMAARARLGEHRFLDVYHRDFLEDSFGTLERIYDFLGFELRPHIREKMQRWQAENHSGAHGQHRYTAEEFGLSNRQLHEDFAFYIEQFDIPLEANR